MSRTALEVLAIGRTKAARTFPYFRSFILKLVPTEVPGMGTIGVTANAVLMYDPAFVVRLSPEDAEFVLVHEVMHLLMNHHSRRGEREGMLWNLAGDLFINPQLTAAGLEPPILDGKKMGIFPTDQEIGLPDNLMAEEYYDRLLAKRKAEQEKRAKQAQQSGSAGESAGGKSSGSQGCDKDSPQSSAESASASGGENPPESSASGGSSSASESQRTSMGGQSRARQSASESEFQGDVNSDTYEGGISESEGGICRGHCGSVAGHEFADEPTGPESGERSEASLENTRRVTAEAVRQHVASKGVGSVPRGLQRWADVQLGTPKVRWQSKLAQACRRVIAYRQGGIDYRYSRPSRRQSAIGFGRGRPILPSLVAPIPRVAVVLDTSGSMGTDEVQAALTEAAGILKAVGAEVEFVACDSRVHVVQKVRSATELKALVRGGGGTDFRPAFAALQNRRDPPEVVIFATDGCGPAPSVMPRGMRVIWLLLGPYKEAPCSWGEQIEID